VRPLPHGLSANFQTFRTACCQKHVAAEGSCGTLRRMGGDSPKLQHPFPVATSSPSGGRGRCSAVAGEGVGGAMASKCPLLKTLSSPTTEVGKILGSTKDSEKESVDNDRGLKTRTHSSLPSTSQQPRIRDR